jgi:hypothetical protein
MATATETRPQNIFTHEEEEHLHTEDVHAARIVVCLMTGVFTMGLLMYAYICWLAM